MTRYALHHFPDIERCFGEISRVLKSGGRLFISDPTPEEGDKDRLVDAFMNYELQRRKERSRNLKPGQLRTAAAALKEPASRNKSSTKRSGAAFRGAFIIT